MIGLIFVMLAQLFYATGGLLIRKYLSGYNPILITAFEGFVSFVVFLPLVLVFYRNDLNVMISKSAIPLLIIGLLNSVIAVYFYNAGIVKAPSFALGSLMVLFFPLFSTILGIVFLHETLTAKTIIAALLMCGGFVLLIIR